MADVKRTLLVRVESVARLCEILTGYGRVTGIDHEGTITYELEEKDEYELGRRSYEIEHELRAEFTNACIVSAVKGKESKKC